MLYRLFNNDDLKIALEPEAASLYVRFLQVKKTEREDGHVYAQSFQSGNRYMVIDAGGNVHRVSKNVDLFSNCYNSCMKC